MFVNFHFHLAKELSFCQSLECTHAVKQHAVDCNTVDSFKRIGKLKEHVSGAGAAGLQKEAWAVRGNFDRSCSAPAPLLLRSCSAPAPLLLLLRSVHMLKEAWQLTSRRGFFISLGGAFISFLVTYAVLVTGPIELSWVLCSFVAVMRCAVFVLYAAHKCEQHYTTTTTNDYRYIKL